MKAKITVMGAVIAALLVLGWATACQRARSDAQVATDVQSKINGDSAVQSRQYTVTAENGVVTLGGYVGNDSERAAAANDAAQVAGVRTVVNNLQVAAPAVAEQVPPPGPPPEAAPPEPAPVERHREAHSKPSGVKSGVRHANAYKDTYAAGGPSVPPRQAPWLLRTRRPHPFRPRLHPSLWKLAFRKARRCRSG